MCEYQREDYGRHIQDAVELGFANGNHGSGHIRLPTKDDNL